MRQSTRNAFTPSRDTFTLVELLVVIAIIGTLVGLLLPAVQAARETARSNTCRSNMTNLQKALTQREQSLREYPGYVNLLGPAGTAANPNANKLRASWVVMTFPYIEQPALWDAWTQGTASAENSRFSAVEILLCPSDPPVAQDQPELAYVANAGWIDQEPNTESGNTPENPANGVFTDRTRVGPSTGPGPQDIRDKTAPDPEVVMTEAYINSKGDGSTNTIMLSENLTAHQWGYRGSDATGVADRKYHFGFCWASPTDVTTPIATTNPDPLTELGYRKINGQRVENSPIFSNGYSEMVANHGFPSSNHPGGINVAFCGGAVTFISDEITPTVYAQLMTSNRKGSDLKDLDGTFERKMKQPGDGEF